MELREAEFQKSAAELKITARINKYYILAIRYILVRLITIAETRLREA